MIVRLVKMHFKPEKVEDFLTFLTKYKAEIRAFPGCQLVEILQKKDQPEVIITHSHWQSESDLENYRVSDLFGFVWANTKIHFQSKAEATTLEVLDSLK
jgi:(4S)-4-hydroxy-5-phosphonooxypentane-2,3-dione isomerase